jgi:hypothetical protein
MWLPDQPRSKRRACTLDSSTGVLSLGELPVCHSKDNAKPLQEVAMRYAALIYSKPRFHEAMSGQARKDAEQRADVRAAYGRARADSLEPERHFLQRRLAQL